MLTYADVCTHADKRSLAFAGATALNFKVRIQATRALGELQSADVFASPAALEDLWRAAVKAVQVCVSPLQW